MTELSTEALRENAGTTFEALTGVSSPLNKGKKRGAEAGSGSDNAKKSDADQKDEDE